ncbi:MAG: ABC transporter ATP-binding protein [Ruminococcus sp.]|nr:ABC transporter ATP-binding protein [Ruminococcus sp.]
MKDILLSGKDICKTFPGKEKEINVLDHVNIDIFKGDFTVIMGSSGTGKSTLLYALGGMDAVTGGSVIFQGEEMNRFSEKKMAALRAEKFGFVFQQTHLVSNLSLLENVVVAGYMGKKQDKRAVEKRAADLLTRMKVEGARNRLPSQVSGGEAQRAAVARSVINEPELIFADEPTGALNKANSEEVLNLLTNLHENGQSILLVTHDVRAAIRGNRLLYLEDGRILDELSLPSYLQDERSDRESRVTQWLASLQW